jgi:hypothetical protein
MLQEKTPYKSEGMNNGGPLRFLIGNASVSRFEDPDDSGRDHRPDHFLRRSFSGPKTRALRKTSTLVYKTLYKPKHFLTYRQQRS